MRNLLIYLCIIFHFVPIKAQSDKITFNEHIAPIIYYKCTPCHREGEIAPFSLTNYDEVHQHSAMIKAVTSTGYMPPWKADTVYSHFSNQLTLTDWEIQLISKWVDKGSQMGKKKTTPPSPTFLSGSNLGKPDLTVCMEQSYQIAGNNTDDYRNFVIPINIKEDKFISAFEFRPGNKKIVHHAWIMIDTTSQGFDLDQQDSAYGYAGFDGMGFEPIAKIPGYLPGFLPQRYPVDIGRKLYANSVILIQIHYAPTPIEEEDLSCISIYFHDIPPSREVEFLEVTEGHLLDGPLFIPAQNRKTFHEQYIIEKDISLISVLPHMHYRGEYFKAFAVTDRNDTISLIQINDWDFNWQNSYWLKHLTKIPRGSMIHVEGTFDNTSDNFDNPIIPPIDAEFGLKSSDEMLEFAIEYVEYKEGDEQIEINTELIKPLEKYIYPKPQ